MSDMKLHQVMGRIEIATKESPIAVFRSEFPEKLNAVFGATVRTKNLIEAKDKDFIGIFDKTMDLYKIEKKLHGFIKK